MKTPFRFRPPSAQDLAPLLDIEQRAFTTDRLSRRRMRHWIHTDNRAFLVCEDTRGLLAGYILFFYRVNSSTARLYSIAVSANHRGHGIGHQLMERGEALVRQSGRDTVHLEVRPGNTAAIALYESLGYRQFGVFEDFYEDHEDALRFEKHLSSARMPRTPGK